MRCKQRETVFIYISVTIISTFDFHSKPETIHVDVHALQGRILCTQTYVKLLMVK